MGVTISTHTTLAPISLASIAIGFISFAVTVFTFLRVFWENIQTIFSASEEVPHMLTTLRQELAEERTSLRALRRHWYAREAGESENGEKKSQSGRRSRDVFAGPELDVNVIRTLQSSIRVLQRKFRAIERPFLASEELRRRDDHRKRHRRRSSRHRGSSDDEMEPYYGGKPGGDEDDIYAEKGGRGRKWEDEEAYGRALYCNITLWRRIEWLRHRGTAMYLLSALSRIQTRRIARQVGEMAVVLHEYGDIVEDMRHKITVTENRLNRVVGLRRVD